MKFDFGEVFTRAWQITWKNKVLWGLTVLPFLVTFLIFPFWLIVVFTQKLDPGQIQSLGENKVFFALLMVLYLVTMVASMILQIASRASVTLGVYRVESNDPSMTFAGLLKDGLAYFWRILGVSFLMFAGMMVFFLAVFACAALASVATMGLGAICIQPLFLLMIPLMLLAMAFLEQSEAAIVADGMNVMDAARRAYELIKANIWKYVLIMFVVYFVMNILVSMVMVPFMVPMFIFMMNNVENSLDFSNIVKLQAVFMVVLFPLMTLIQGFALTYMKSAMVVTYLRLTRSSSDVSTAMQAVPA